MAKKSFKSGLTSIIEESLNVLSSSPEADPNEIKELKDKISQLEQRIALLERELYYWRNGILTPEKFKQSLKQRGLKYNPNTNQIEKA
jgi:exonuclease VII small subunit